MRLTEHQIITIVRAVKDRFGCDAHVYLFGSRLDDAVKGGDIDLFIDLPDEDKNMVRHSCQAIADIQRALGEQKIDMVVRHPGLPDQSIFAEALEQGVLLNPESLNM